MVIDDIINNGHYEKAYLYSAINLFHPIYNKESPINEQLAISYIAILYGVQWSVYSVSDNEELYDKYIGDLVDSKPKWRTLKNKIQYHLSGHLKEIDIREEFVNLIVKGINSISRRWLDNIDDYKYGFNYIQYKYIMCNVFVVYNMRKFDWKYLSNRILSESDKRVRKESENMINMLEYYKSKRKIWKNSVTEWIVERFIRNIINLSEKS